MAEGAAFDENRKMLLNMAELYERFAREFDREDFFF